MKKFVYNPFDSAVAFIGAIVLQVVLMLGFAVFLATYSGFTGMDIQTLSQNHFSTIMAIILAEGAFALTFILLNLFKGYDGFKAAKIAKRVSFQNIALSFIIALVALFGFLGIANLMDIFVEWMGYPIVASLPLPLDNIWWLILNLVLLAALPAIFEELLFRGVILTGLLHLGTKKAVLLSALLFMLIHGNIQQTLYQFAFGIVLGILFIKTASLLPVIIAHFVNNAVVIIWQFFAIGAESTLAVEFSLPLLMFAVGTAVLACIVLKFLFKFLKKEKLQESEKYVVDVQTGNLIMESDSVNNPIGISIDENFSIKVHTMEEEKLLYEQLEESKAAPQKLTYSTKVILFLGIGVSVLIWVSDFATKIIQNQ